MINELMSARFTVTPRVAGQAAIVVEMTLSEIVQRLPGTLRYEVFTPEYLGYFLRVFSSFDEARDYVVSIGDISYEDQLVLDRFRSDVSLFLLAR
jgi:hypothetical protein